MRIAVPLLLLLTTLLSRAEITAEQSLGFGQFALGGNNVESTLRIPFDGGQPRASNQLFPLSHGQAGHYRLSALPAFTPLMITIADFELRAGLSEPLRVQDFSHNNIITDANGEVLLKLGATLKTTASGTPYGDGTYSGIMNITISW